MLLKIQDKEYLLRYDINALILLEEITGQSITNALKEDMGIKMLRNLLYVGLKRNHKEITLESVGDLIEEYLDADGDMEKLSELITVAFSKSSLTSKKK
jgi:hypothetical protein